MKYRLLLFMFCFVLSLPSACFGARIVNLVEVVLRVEDSDFKNTMITSLNFAGNEIDLGKPGIADFRKEIKMSFPPGLYSVNWTTQKGDIVWVSKAVKEIHQSTIELEKTDTVVYVRIRGDRLSLY